MARITRIPEEEGVSLRTMGLSYENNSIHTVVVCKSGGIRCRDRPAIIIDGGKKKRGHNQIKSSFFFNLIK